MYSMLSVYSECSEDMGKLEFTCIISGALMGGYFGTDRSLYHAALFCSLEFQFLVIFLFRVRVCVFLETDWKYRSISCRTD